MPPTENNRSIRAEIWEDHFIYVFVVSRSGGTFGIQSSKRLGNLKPESKSLFKTFEIHSEINRLSSILGFGVGVDFCSGNR